MPEQRGVFDCHGFPMPLAVTLLSNTLVQNQNVGSLVVDVSALLANVFCSLGSYPRVLHGVESPRPSTGMIIMFVVSSVYDGL